MTLTVAWLLRKVTWSISTGTGRDTHHDSISLSLIVECFDAGGGRPFLFLNVIADHAQFQDILTSCWNKPVGGCKMFQVWSKLKEVKAGVKQLHTTHYGLGIESLLSSEQEALHPPSLA